MPHHVRFELLLIAVLLPLVAVFAFWYVPASIEVPGGFGSGSEISPRFAPYLIATLMAVAMLARVLQLVWLGAQSRLREVPDDRGGVGTTEETTRGAIVNLTGLVYGFVLIPLAGFYLASFALMSFLVHRLGERRPMVVVLIALATVAFIYVLFEQVLSVRLPRGALGEALRASWS